MNEAELQLILFYRGLSTGIPRTLGEWPGIQFENEVAKNQFKPVAPRPTSDNVTPEVTPEVARLLRVLQDEMSREKIGRSALTSNRLPLSRKIA